MAEQVLAPPGRIVVWDRRPPRPQAVRRAVDAERRASPRPLVVVASLILLVSMGVRSWTSTGPSASTVLAYAASDERAADHGAVLVAPLETLSADPPADTAWSAAAVDPDQAAPGMTVDAPALSGWYRLAAAEYGISDQLLRALHQVESNASPDGCVANIEDSGAVGPFQFKPATFGQYGVDANLDGDRDICSFADALFSAARYLRALGAEDLDSAATRAALVRYGTDSDRVLALARHYRDVAALRP